MDHGVLIHAILRQVVGNWSGYSTQVTRKQTKIGVYLELKPRVRRHHGRAGPGRSMYVRVFWTCPTQFKDMVCVCICIHLRIVRYVRVREPRINEYKYTSQLENTACRSGSSDGRHRHRHRKPVAGYAPHRRGAAPPRPVLFPIPKKEERKHYRND